MSIFDRNDATQRREEISYIFIAVNLRNRPPPLSNEIPLQLQMCYNKYMQKRVTHTKHIYESLSRVPFSTPFAK